MGRTNFTRAEIDQLRALVGEKQTADRSRQKTLRARMRRLGFYITDFADYSGFAVSDLDHLIQRGTITVTDHPTSTAASTTPTGMVEDDRPSPGGDDGHLWYEELRERYRPERLRVLLVGESPPDPGDGERRFFFAPRLTYDNLYRGVADAVYGARGDVDIRDKLRVLELLCADGFWLIDAVDSPIDNKSSAARRDSIRVGLPRLVEQCRELAPERGVVICHGVVYEIAAPAIRAAGVRLLHDEPLPFPLGNWRQRFVAGLRASLRE
jgi:hypothetical protein